LPKKIFIDSWGDRGENKPPTITSMHCHNTSLYPRNEVRGYTGFSVSDCPSVFRVVFWTFFGLILQIMTWNLVWLFTIMLYRSSLSFVLNDQYLTELWALGLRIFIKISVFRTFFRLILQILKWNLVWLFTVMNYRSSLGFVAIDQ
jgi:hypothetical protein